MRGLLRNACLLGLFAGEYYGSCLTAGGAGRYLSHRPGELVVAERQK